MSEIVVGSTMAPFKATDDEDRQWLTNAEEMVFDAHSAGFTKIFFLAAAEMDARGMDVYRKLDRRLREINTKFGDDVEADMWRFAIDDHADSIDSLNRLIRICTGRNLIQEFALRRRKVSHILFLDSDLVVPPDSISKLVEMDHPIVGGDVPSYCMNGEPQSQFSYPVHAHWNTAGFLMVQREVARRVAWRTDVYDSGNTDDPAYAAAVEELGFGKTYVRKDLIGAHKPLVGLLRRGHDLKVYR